MTTALITGATSGLGLGFCEALASQGHDLVVVARDNERLEEVASSLQDKHRVSVEMIAADLSDPQERGVVEERACDSGRPIDVLVNNAGFALKGRFLDSDLGSEQALLDVLVTASMRLCRLAGPGMVERGRGIIINVASIAAWMPTGTYGAAKAYVVSFTEALAMELKGSGVSATALCPGYVHTELHQRAGMNMGSVPEFMWLNVEDVVAAALKDAKAGKTMSVPGLQYQAVGLATRYTPRPLVRWAFSRR